MKTPLVAAIAALVAGSVLCAPAAAQMAASANASQYGIAVVDINYIFKNHEKFRSAMDGMKEDFKQVEAGVKGSQQRIAQLNEQKKAFKPGTPQFKDLDEQITRGTADLQVEVAQKRKQLVEREAQIYYQTYLEVQAAIKRYAEYKKIGLVVRFNGEEADPANRESILRSINKAVHFQNQIDITPDILAMLNRNAASTAGRQQAAPR
ncbi:MAG: OmpH family outer membrane protein [Planctomycetota bacterium]